MSHIPYITLRTGEDDVSEEHLTYQIVNGSRPILSYRNQRPADLYRGMLWTRVTQSLDTDGRPVGRPIWGAVHSLRQRECMRKLLCHYCKGPASRTSAGYLFLDVVDNAQRASPKWPNRYISWVTGKCCGSSRRTSSEM